MGGLSWVHWLIVAIVVMLLFGGRGKISSIMGDVAQGIKAFKKGMSEDEKTADAKTEPMKTIDGQPVDPAKQHAQTERKFEGSTS